MEEMNSINRARLQPRPVNMVMQAADAASILAIDLALAVRGNLSKFANV